jgi:hypothetical protein
MKTRDVVIFSGHRFQVPQCIQRIDHRYTHGWQVRYGGTKMFSDGTNDGSGAAASLDAATRELVRRIATLPTPSKLQPKPSASKESGLPVGISGPLVRMRTGSSTRYASLQVLLPRFGDKPQNKNVYIGSESTYTQERFQEALQRAVDMRHDAEARYREAEAKARKAEARALKAQLGAAPARAKPASKPVAKSIARPAGKPVAKVAPQRTAAKPSPARPGVAKPAAKPAGKGVAKSGGKPAAKPLAATAAKPAVKVATKAASKGAAKGAAKAATKAATKAAAKPASGKTAARKAGKSA